MREAMKNTIYLDNAATTRLYSEVLDIMLPYMQEDYANPSSVYQFAGKSKNVIEQAREDLADCIGAKAEEIYFTSGGSEADNWAIKMIAEGYAHKGKHIITSKIEHHAVLHACEYLEHKGFEVTYLDVNEEGIVDINALEEAIREDTILITIMMANNEIGTIQPVEEIGRIAKVHKVLFHTDGVQAFGHVPISVEGQNIDMLSVSGHKFHGPKGVGFLYIKKGIKVLPFIHGGAQERGKRAGTHNVPGIIGMAAAAKMAVNNLQENQKKQVELREYAINRIEKEIPYSMLNGSRDMRLPNNIHFCFRFIEGESLLILLDREGICASSGSACTSGSLDPSHVLLAIGRPHEIAHGSLRLTISEETTKEEMDFTIDCLKKIVDRLRKMSPLYEDFEKENQED